MVSWSEQTDIAGLFLIFMIFFSPLSVWRGGGKIEIKKIIWITRSLEKSLTPAEGQQPCAPLPYLVHWLKQQQQLRRCWMLQGPKGLAALRHWIRNTQREEMSSLLFNSLCGILSEQALYPGMENSEASHWFRRLGRSKNPTFWFLLNKTNKQNNKKSTGCFNMFLLLSLQRLL